MLFLKDLVSGRSTEQGYLVTLGFFNISGEFVRMELGEDDRVAHKANDITLQLESNFASASIYRLWKRAF